MPAGIVVVSGLSAIRRSGLQNGVTSTRRRLGYIRTSDKGGRLYVSRKKTRQTPKRVLRLPGLEFAKSAVLNTLRSSESKRSYRFAIEDFVPWYCSEPRLAFNKTVVLRYRLELEARRLSSSTINLRLAAVRRCRVPRLS